VTGAAMRMVPANRLKGFQPRLECARRWSSRFGVSQGAGHRAADRLQAATMLTLDSADRWCVVFGLHLSEVYPELYTEHDEAVA
jgi:hypothetical protein